MTCAKHGWKLGGCPTCEEDSAARPFGVHYRGDLAEGKHDWAPPHCAPYCRRCGAMKNEARALVDCAWRFPPGRERWMPGA
jgi:hypothetical protein